jgi:hypothetical protein
MSKQTQEPLGRNGAPGHDSGSGRWQDIVTILAPHRDKTAILPAGYPLRLSTFTRLGKHLVVKAPRSPDVVVGRFFGDGEQTTLATEDGVELSRHIILLMSNLSARVEKALGALSAPHGD